MNQRDILKNTEELINMNGLHSYLFFNSENRLFTKRSDDLDKISSIIIKMIAHAFMIINPLPGQEYTRNKNMNDLVQKWMRSSYKAWIESKITITMGINKLKYTHNLSSKVKKELLKNHGYKYIDSSADQAYMYLIVNALENAIIYTSRARIPLSSSTLNEFDEYMKQELIKQFKNIPTIEVR